MEKNILGDSFDLSEALNLGFPDPIGLDEAAYPRASAVGVVAYAVKKSGNANAAEALRSILGSKSIMASKAQKNGSGDKNFVSTSTTLFSMLDDSAGTYPVALLLDGNYLANNYEAVDFDWYSDAAYYVSDNGVWSGFGGNAPVGVQWLAEYTNDKNPDDRIYVMKANRVNKPFILTKSDFDVCKLITDEFNREVPGLGNAEYKPTASNAERLEYGEDNPADKLDKVLIDRAGKNVDDSYTRTKFLHYGSAYAGWKLSVDYISKYTRYLSSALKSQFKAIDFMAKITSKDHIDEAEVRFLTSGGSISVAGALLGVMLPVKWKEEFYAENGRFAALRKSIDDSDLADKIYWYDDNKSRSSQEKEIRSAIKNDTPFNPKPIETDLKGAYHLLNYDDPNDQKAIDAVNSGKSRSENGKQRYVTNTLKVEYSRSRVVTPAEVPDNFYRKQFIDGLTQQELKWVARCKEAVTVAINGEECDWPEYDEPTISLLPTNDKAFISALRRTYENADSIDVVISNGNTYGFKVRLDLNGTELKPNGSSITSTKTEFHATGLAKLTTGKSKDALTLTITR